MKHNKKRYLLSKTFACALSLFIIGSTAVSCSAVSINKPIVPPTTKPEQPQGPESGGQQPNPGPQRPTLTGVNIKFEKPGPFVAGKEVTATAITSPSDIGVNITYKWSIDGSATAMFGRDAKTVHFSPDITDNKRMLRVVATYEGKDVETYIQLEVIPNGSITPTPPPTISPDKPTPTPPPPPVSPNPIKGVNISFANLPEGGVYEEGQNIEINASVNPSNLSDLKYKLQKIDNSGNISSLDYGDLNTIRLVASLSDNFNKVKLIVWKDSFRAESNELTLRVKEAVSIPTPLPPEPSIPEPPVPTPPAPQPPVKPVEPPAATMNFVINIRRSSGFTFRTDVIYFDIYDADTNTKVKEHVCDFDDKDDKAVTVNLPSNKRYYAKVVTPEDYGGNYAMSISTYKYPEKVFFDKDQPIVDYVFDPIIVDGLKEGFYTYDDVAHEIPFQYDAVGKPISLKQDAKEGKATILMYMRTTCSRSRASLKVLNKAIGWNDAWEKVPENWNKVNVICFSDADSEETLRNFQETEWPQFHFVYDPTSIFKNEYFRNDSGYPKFVYLDYQGVFIERKVDQLFEDKGIPFVRNFVKNYSKHPVSTTNLLTKNVIAYKKEQHD